ncbi:LTA synthase family protein [Bifidobacterium parmae]|uniref:LTA synthase family protein n=1 Tax=Bifidobacterium parmae TaxID=361854 RepID=UPI003C2C1E92
MDGVSVEQEQPAQTEHADVRPAMLDFVDFRHHAHMPITDAETDAMTASIADIKTSDAFVIAMNPPIRLLLSALRSLLDLWRKRPKCPYTLYVVVMALMTAAATIFIQWGMYSEPSYDDPNAVDDTTKALNSVNGQLTRFVAQMWLSGDGASDLKLNWLLNFLALGMIYLVLVFVLNRFWVATAVFAIVMSVYAVANSIKMVLRNEPILPSDLSFISSGNGGEISSFIPEDSQALVDGTITMLVWLTVICLILQFLDGRRCVIPFHWWRPFRNVRTVIGNLTRFVAAGTSIALLCSFTWTLSIPGAWGYEWAKSWGDVPQPWSATGDATINGAVINFLRLTHPKIMDKPEGYSRETMEALAKKYARQAKATNQTRANNLTDSTVIMVLSETFSDPTRVPGISLLEDPMPNIRTVKDSTTSGLMLSPGYGGGTANIEYQTLTGLDLALFDDSMQSIYQELVPHQKSPYSFNQIWNARYGKTGSTAFHPYYKNMYLRDTDYKKFGFDHFYTLDSDPAITHQDRIDNNPYVSDAAAYQNVLDQVNKESHPQFLQLVTMQNHMPHDGWYNDNQFWDANVSENLGDGERYAVNTYIKGLSLTDQATADFLNQLNTMDKPVTVIFYGDHLSSDYVTAASDKNNTLTLHETDYFIWSNQASGAAGAGVKLDPATANTNYTSPNYFMAMASEHMNTKVSPYLQFLSSVRADLPAVERLVLGAGGFTDDTSTTYLDGNGNPIKRKNLSKEQRQLLKEYRLIQYDMTAGKNYLAGTSFFGMK